MSDTNQEIMGVGAESEKSFDGEGVMSDSDNAHDAVAQGASDSDEENGKFEPEAMRVATEYLALKGKHSNVTKELIEVKAKHSTVAEKLIELQGVYLTAMAATHQLKTDHDSLDRKAQELDEKLQQKEATIARFREENSSLRQGCGDARERVKALESENSSLLSAHAELVQRATEQEASVKTRIEKAEGAAKNWETSMAKALDGKFLAEKETARLQEENQSLVEQLAQSAGEVEKLRASQSAALSSAAQGLNAEHEAKVRESEAALRERDASLRESEAALSEREAALREKEREILVLKAEVEGWRAKAQDVPDPTAYSSVTPVNSEKDWPSPAFQITLLCSVLLNLVLFILVLCVLFFFPRKECVATICRAASCPPAGWLDGWWWMFVPLLPHKSILQQLGTLALALVALWRRVMAARSRDAAVDTGEAGEAEVINPDPSDPPAPQQAIVTPDRAVAGAPLVDNADTPTFVGQSDPVAGQTPLDTVALSSHVLVDAAKRLDEQPASSDDHIVPADANDGQAWGQEQGRDRRRTLGVARESVNPERIHTERRRKVFPMGLNE